MVKFPEAMKRMFDRVFVCKKCKSKIRADAARVIQNKVACRKCGYNQLRTIHKGTK